MALPVAPTKLTKVMAVTTPSQHAVETKRGGRSTAAEVFVSEFSEPAATRAQRLCDFLTHPTLNVTLMTADRKAGQSLSTVFPHLATQTQLPDMVAIKDADFEKVDAIFCCLPHGTTQEIIASIPKHLKDFQLKDANVYKEWYNRDHVAPQLLAGRIEEEDITIDAKSGVSGAGRSAKEAYLYTEVDGGMKAYGINGHRHVPEIEQELSKAGGKEVKITFTATLSPMPRGMLATIYVQMKDGATADDLRDHLSKAYQGEEFVHILPKRITSSTSHVKGSNYCLIGVYEARIPGRATIVSMIDNLVKGASGQALQNMNLMLGLPETLGLLQQCSLASRQP